MARGRSRGLWPSGEFTWTRGVVLCACALGVAFLGIVEVRHLREKKALETATEQLKKGFPAVAAETLDPYRVEFAHTEPGCSLLISAYLYGLRMDRLNWAAEACIEAGHDNPTTQLGLALAQFHLGREKEGIDLLARAAARFPNSAEIHHKLAQLLRRKSRDGEAAEEFEKTLSLAPNDVPVALEALDFLSVSGHWKEAGAVAQRLKNTETDSPQVKLLLAQALRKTGDAESARQLIAQAQLILSAKPALRGTMIRLFPELESELRAPAGSP